MFQNIFLVFILLITTSVLHAQDEYEYLGLIKLNDTALISYQLKFIETDGLVEGYSLTDSGGAHETKSFVSGYFDDDLDTLEFTENSVLYTKSYVVEDDFCYVHFKGSLKKLSLNQQIVGDFEGFYPDGSKCLDGDIRLASFGKILKKTANLDKRIDKSLLVKKDVKELIDLSKSLDSLSMRFINKEERLSVFTSRKNISLSLQDVGQEDGDIVHVFVNDKLVLRDYSVLNTPKSIDIAIVEENTVIRIVARSTGSLGENTVQLVVSDGENAIDTVTNLKKDEFAEIIVIKRE
jgi:hypothetical protein